ncbi:MULTISPECIES: mandelate racemase/muconate lactonizing enzyme family protein [Halorussus]|uniref:mandelate racemase/muconate lactonizing enzyme family protein n=1 Tax=Halorussus TaxID=1070314 RepID=UPI00209D9D46|nr:mandelate racemase/muconate lactonizing enzyme family protein [Halorussus vallis]USZ78388.1 mandelate racemase/muconate lactonizing enzyme family protein [Halorussus vallis]
MVPRSDVRDVEITDVQTTRIGSTFEWTLVRVYTDAGVTGTGEMVLGPKADAYVEHAKELIVGKNPVDIDARCTELYDGLAYLGGMNGVGVTAVSGIDVALHDLAGKLLDVPAYQLLGGKHRDDVRVYCDVHAGEHLHETDADDGGAYEPSAYAAAAEAVVEEGYDAIKFDLDGSGRHVGDPKNKHLNARAIDFRADIVEAVTESVGDRADVAFDCHWSWTGDTVRRLTSAIERYDVWWLEDTVPPENHDVQTYVTHNTDVTIAAGENVYRVEGARRLIENHGIDVIHPDVPKNGGMLETKKIADMAKAYYIPLALHNVASPVGTMASAHVAAAASNFLALEFHARDVNWWSDVVTERILESGRIEVPDEPGLGVEVDLDVVSGHLLEGETLFDEE